VDPAPLPQLYGGRFRLESEAIRGGMGTVYGARDLVTGERVALKVLHDDRPGAADRFRQEAALLADLRHPAIVRYIDHGVTGDGGLYLAMEWLAGETLEQRLGRGPLGVLPTVQLARRVLDALAFAHGRGVVHRDLKPPNLLLLDGSLAGVKLLDFGVARRLVEGQRLTRTGSTVGTPLYMSPEQARGVRVLDARSDFFSLGALLVECLTGKPAFAAETNLAIMVKICMDALDLRAACPDAPPHLVDLLSAMLAKRPEDRPARADHLRDEMARLHDALLAATSGGDEGPPREVTPRPTLALEQRVLSAIVLSLPPGAGSAEDETDTHQVVSAALEEFSARVDRFLGGVMLITMRDGGTPTDQAVRAARCALRLQRLIPGAVLAMSTGRAMVGAQMPVGELVDRASLLLDGQQPGTIVVDPPTTSLLDRAFEISTDSGWGRLLFERAGGGDPGTGERGSPFVGRERELGTLLAMLEECIREPVARAVLVTSAAGGGKSRLRQELIRRAQARGDRFDLLVGRGDPIRAGAPFGMLGPALRAAAGITDGELLPVQRNRLLAMVARHLPVEAATRVAVFLGELAGVPFSEADLPALRSAREDPRVMADQMLVAWLDWIEAACRAGPLLLVLEDLHWGDGPSVEFVDAALRTLPESPLMVLALSRPEGDGRFPGLWKERALHRLALPPLTPRSCQQLIQQLAGDLGPGRASWVIERADGNAFYLEELVRAAVGVDTALLSSLPDSVLGMVQARFDALGTEVRRVLRAASVFGQTFSADGVSAVVEDGAAVRSALEVLEGREIVLPRPAGGARQFTFRHALLREGAYEMLTEEDRRLAHGRAGEYLEGQGEHDAIVLVEHFERGGLPARAVKHCARAAAQSLEANDLDAAIERTERGIANGARDETRGQLRLIEAQARLWRGEYVEDERAAREAAALVRGPSRLHALGELVAALGQQGRYLEIEPVLGEARTWPETAQHPAAWHAALARACSHLPSGGRIELTEALLDEVDAAAPAEPSLRGQLHLARGLLALGRAQLAAAARHCRESVSAFEAAGDFRRALEARSNLTAAVGNGGQLEEAEQHLRELLGIIDRLDLRYFHPMLLCNLGSVRADRGALEEGQALVERALAAARRQGDLRSQGFAVQILALLATRAGRHAEAEALAREAASTGVATLRPFALAVLAGALRGQGRIEEALAEAREANRLLEAQGYVEDGEAAIRLALIECLMAAGDLPAARQAASAASRRLFERAAALDDARWRAGFLKALPDHRRTLELTRALAPAGEPYR
jgi:tetratricopeptide (TPR) repeat protein